MYRIQRATIQYVRHNVSWIGSNQNRPTEACFQTYFANTHSIPETTFRQITPIPLIEYISIHQRRVFTARQPCLPSLDTPGENREQYFSPNRPRPKGSNFYIDVGDRLGTLFPSLDDETSRDPRPTFHGPRSLHR